MKRRNTENQYQLRSFSKAPKLQSEEKSIVESSDEIPSTTINDNHTNELLISHLTNSTSENTRQKQLCELLAIAILFRSKIDEFHAQIEQMLKEELNIDI